MLYEITGLNFAYKQDLWLAGVYPQPSGKLAVVLLQHADTGTSITNACEMVAGWAMTQILDLRGKNPQTDIEWFESWWSKFLIQASRFAYDSLDYAGTLLLGSGMIKVGGAEGMRVVDTVNFSNYKREEQDWRIESPNWHRASEYLQEILLAQVEQDMLTQYGISIIKPEEYHRKWVLLPRKEPPPLAFENYYPILVAQKARRDN